MPEQSAVPAASPQSFAEQLQVDLGCLPSVWSFLSQRGKQSAVPAASLQPFVEQLLARLSSLQPVGSCFLVYAHLQPCT